MPRIGNRLRHAGRRLGGDGEAAEGLPAGRRQAMTDAITTAAALETAHDAHQVPDGFGVRDGQTANWVVRKIVEARAYAVHVQEWAAREIRRAQGDEKFFLHRYGHQLEEWARRQLEAEDGRRKSVN